MEEVVGVKTRVLAKRLVLNRKKGCMSFRMEEGDKVDICK